MINPQVKASAEALAAFLTMMELNGVHVAQGAIVLESSEVGALTVHVGWSDGDPWVVLEPGQRVTPGNVIKSD